MTRDYLATEDRPYLSTDPDAMRGGGSTVIGPFEVLGSDPANYDAGVDVGSVIPAGAVVVTAWIEIAEGNAWEGDGGAGELWLGVHGATKYSALAKYVDGEGVTLAGHDVFWSATEIQPSVARFPYRLREASHLNFYWNINGSPTLAAADAVANLYAIVAIPAS